MEHYIKGNSQCTDLDPHTWIHIFPWMYVIIFVADIFCDVSFHSQLLFADGPYYVLAVFLCFYIHINHIPVIVN